MQLSVKYRASVHHYISLFSAVLLLDRITKYAAVHYVSGEYRLSAFLSCQPVLNRGIVCGIFNSLHTTSFILTSLLVFSIYALLVVYTYFQWKEHRSIFAELLILAGGLSNIIDRFIYNGVVDFIVLSYKDWFWPVFNVADACIVCGVILMVLTCFDKS